MAQYTRQTAIPCTLAEIAAGEWVQQGGVAPSGVRTVRGLVARVNIFGVVVDKGQDASLVIDDGTASLRVRSFDPQAKVSVGIGDVALVIGRPREYNGERYIVLEICKKLRKEWIPYRKKELAYFSGFVIEEDVVEQPAGQPAQSVTVQDTGKNPFELLIDTIRRLDTGNGADSAEVIAMHPEGERLLRALLEEGEVFEIRPGRIKVLE